MPKKVKDYGMFFILKFISNAWFILGGMWPKNYHRNKIDFSKSYLIAPNHQSFLDAGVIYTAVPKLFKSLGKKEIEKTPIYGIIYKMVVITVDRSSVSAKANSFRRMKKEMEEGLSIVLFPEGTFANHPQNELMPFENGSFVLAHMQQVDILPVLFLNTVKRMHPSKLHIVTPGWNRAVFLPPISTKEIEKADLELLKNYCQQYMQTCLDFCRKNNPIYVWDFAVTWLQNNKLK
jgi:1-acyl-sn-glycerol-3-phosphate acyltransferase